VPKTPNVRSSLIKITAIAITYFIFLTLRVVYILLLNDLFRYLNKQGYINENGYAVLWFLFLLFTEQAPTLIVLIFTRSFTPQQAKETPADDKEDDNDYEERTRFRRKKHNIIDDYVDDPEQQQQTQDGDLEAGDAAEEGEDGDKQRSNSNVPLFAVGENNSSDNNYNNADGESLTSNDGNKRNSVARRNTAHASSSSGKKNNNRSNSTTSVRPERSQSAFVSQPQQPSNNNLIINVDMPTATNTAPDASHDDRIRKLSVHLKD